MKGFLLLNIAIILSLVIIPIGFTIECLCNLFHLNKYLFKVALSLDQLGNVVCARLLTFTVINKHGYPFGNEDESISSVLGKNKESGTLTRTGKLLSNLLNKIESNHVEKAVEVNP